MKKIKYEAPIALIEYKILTPLGYVRHESSEHLFCAIASAIIIEIFLHTIRSYDFFDLINKNE